MENWNCPNSITRYNLPNKYNANIASLSFFYGLIFNRKTAQTVLCSAKASMI